RINDLRSELLIAVTVPVFVSLMIVQLMRVDNEQPLLNFWPFLAVAVFLIAGLVFLQKHGSFLCQKIDLRHSNKLCLLFPPCGLFPTLLTAANHRLLRKMVSPAFRMR